MSWKVKFSHSSDKFIEKGKVTRAQILTLVKKVIKFFGGEAINLDIIGLTHLKLNQIVRGLTSYNSNTRRCDQP